MNINQFFAKDDTSDDSLFYEIPRLMTHIDDNACICLLYTSPSPRDLSTSRMPSSA